MFVVNFYPFYKDENGYTLVSKTPIQKTYNSRDEGKRDLASYLDKGRIITIRDDELEKVKNRAKISDIISLNRIHYACYKPLKTTSKPDPNPNLNSDQEWLSIICPFIPWIISISIFLFILRL